MVSYLQVSDLTKSYGDKILFENISFGLHEGQRMALVARNGKGKTSLLKILSSKDSADSGDIVFRNDIRVAFLEQIPNLKGETVIDACFSSDNEIVRIIARYEQLVQLQEKNPNVFECYIDEYDELWSAKDLIDLIESKQNEEADPDGENINNYIFIDNDFS